MSTREKLIKARLGMLALAEELQNISLAFRKTFYESLQQLQADLDRYFDFNNRDRARQGYRTQGRTPYQTFLEGIKTTRVEEAKPVAA